MPASPVKRFRAPLEPGPNNLGWLIARIPFDIEKAWTRRVRLRVKVDVAGESFRTSLFADPAHGGHFILANKAMQKAAGAKLGSMVDFAVEPDLDERKAEVTPEFDRILKRERKLARWFAEQSQSMQREVGKWLADAKSADARQNRAEQMAERMMQAMEGEKTLPPVIEVAFRMRPAARKGWEAMTLAQRRSALLAVFYYRSPEARERRVQKLVQDCLKLAAR